MQEFLLKKHAKLQINKLKNKDPQNYARINCCYTKLKETPIFTALS